MILNARAALLDSGMGANDAVVAWKWGHGLVCIGAPEVCGRYLITSTPAWQAPGLMRSCEFLRAERWQPQVVDEGLSPLLQ